MTQQSNYANNKFYLVVKEKIITRHELLKLERTGWSLYLNDTVMEAVKLYDLYNAAIWEILKAYDDFYKNLERSNDICFKKIIVEDALKITACEILTPMLDKLK